MSKVKSPRSRTSSLRGKQKSRGVSLYLTMVILSIMTAALLGLVNLAVSQIKIMGTLSNSVGAFYAADAGIERASYALYKTNPVPDWHPDNLLAGNYLGDCVIPASPSPCYGQPCDICPLAQWEDAGAGGKYKVCISAGSNSVIYSTGEFEGTQRKIEISF